jgi:hypothetical protein
MTSPAPSPPRAGAGPSDAPRSFLVGMAAYFVLAVIGIVVVATIDDPPIAVAVVAALLPAGAAAYALVGQFRSMRSQEGVERLVYTDSAAIAFFVILLSALAWFFLEALADAPHLSAFATWIYGVVVWVGIYVVLGRRYR